MLNLNSSKISSQGVSATGVAHRKDVPELRRDLLQAYCRWGRVPSVNNARYEPSWRVIVVVP